jgi:hypothetical protein
VLFATVGEVTGSLVWGVYHYRLHNLPLFIPPAHGLVYLSGIALSRSLRARNGSLGRRSRRSSVGDRRPDGAASGSDSLPAPSAYRLL